MSPHAPLPELEPIWPEAPRLVPDLAFPAYRFLGDLEVTLCNHCLVDLSSHDPAWFGLREQRELGPGRFTVVRVLHDPEPGRDKFCPTCSIRLAFLRFISKVRERTACQD